MIFNTVLYVEISYKQKWESWKAVELFIYFLTPVIFEGKK